MPPVTLPIQQTYLRHVSLHGFYLGTRSEMQALTSLVAQRRIRPCTGRTLPLAEASEAHRLMEAGEVAGKIVLTV